MTLGEEAGKGISARTELFEQVEQRRTYRLIVDQVAQRIRVDASLGIQAASESIEVQASAIQFDTDTSTVSSLRTEEAVHLSVGE